MNTPVSQRNGGRLLVDQLVAFGVDTVFGVPGESYLPVLDGLFERRADIRMIVNRHEGGACFMAEAYAKFTGGVGICFVTRGPGATNASIGVHTAQQDSTPLILFVGQVGGEFVDRDAFQEVDYRRMFGPLAKWVGQIDRADRIPEYLAHAFAVARQGRTGPVVLALPEDMLSASVEVPHAAPVEPACSAPSRSSLRAIEHALADAERPILILGGSGWTAESCADARAFAELNALPVVCSFLRQDLFDNEHPNYVGDAGLGINPKLADRIRRADLVIALNCRLAEASMSGYTLLNASHARQSLIHIYPGSEDLGRTYSGRIHVLAHVTEACATLRTLRTSASEERNRLLRAARDEYIAWQLEPPAVRGKDLNPWAIVAELKRQLPPDAVIANGAGNFATWIHRFWRYHGAEHARRTQLAPTNGAMGYAIPAAIAAKLADPLRAVVAVTGDGDCLMTAQELATAAQYQAGIVVLVFNNRMYGTIRMHQERKFPGRELGTALTNPDFAALCRAFGGYGERVAETAEFSSALARALEFTRKHRSPALVELALDPEVITPDATLSAIRAAAQAADSSVSSNRT